MASIKQLVVVRDSTSTPPGLRKTGLTLTWVQLKKLSDGTNAPQPTFTELGNGQYSFGYDAEVNGEAAGQIDAGAGLTNPSDRYIDVLMTLDSSRLQSALTGAGQVALSPGDSPVVHSGVIPAQVVGASSFTLQGTASAQAQVYRGAFLKITSGAGAGQTRRIKDYLSLVATVDEVWDVLPAAGDTYTVLASWGPSTKRLGVQQDPITLLMSSMLSLSPVVGTVMDAFASMRSLARGHKHQRPNSNINEYYAHDYDVNTDTGTVLYPLNSVPSLSAPTDITEVQE